MKTGQWQIVELKIILFLRLFIYLYNLKHLGIFGICFSFLNVINICVLDAPTSHSGPNLAS